METFTIIKSVCLWSELRDGFYVWEQKYLCHYLFSQLVHFFIYFIKCPFKCLHCPKLCLQISCFIIPTSPKISWYTYTVYTQLQSDHKLTRSLNKGGTMPLCLVAWLLQSLLFSNLFINRLLCVVLVVYILWSLSFFDCASALLF